MAWPAGTAMMQGHALLEVRGLTKRYLGLTAVDGLSYFVGQGEVIGIIGPNGSGKSTSIDCLTGFQPADAGEWFLQGQPLTGLAPHRIAHAGLVRTFQNVRAYDEMSLLENLTIASQEQDGVGWWRSLAGGAGLRRAESRAATRGRELLALIGMSDRAEAPAAALSYGQRKLLAIASAMMTRPKLVVLDEPVAGVNPTMIRSIEQAIRRLNADNVALIIIEHNVDFVMNLCTRVIVLESGRKIAEGPPSLIRSDQRVLEAYLGKARGRRAAGHA
jgi:branched-chain amino acid transport system ATP-binding protein